MTAIRAFLLLLLLAPVAVAADLVSISGDPFIVDLRYHTTENFLKTDVYGPLHLDHCEVLPELRRRLLRLVPELKRRELKLVFWDCFRPIAIQRQMWLLVPDTRYVADPKRGSNHNRGAAVDVTLAREDGTLLAMPTGFDAFGKEAHLDYRCPEAESERCANRDLLATLMKGIGLTGLDTEWWHFQLSDSRKYPIR